MDGRLLLQLGWVFEAEHVALTEDPDGKQRSKDGYREHCRADLRRRLTDEEEREVARLSVTASHIYYRARCAGFPLNGLVHAFGDEPQPERG
jgi:hypothetical protein